MASLAETMQATRLRQAEVAAEAGLTRKALNATLRREREGLGIRAATRGRYMEAIERILQRKRTQLVAAAHERIAEGEELLETLGAR